MTVCIHFAIFKNKSNSRDTNFNVNRFFVHTLYVSDAIQQKTGSYANFHCVFFFAIHCMFVVGRGLESSQHADILSFVAKYKMRAFDSMLRMFVVK